ncbi:unnamed protein product [marine sediment metagenome]|uniref:Helix-turn-helix domain-containing protein n=1 Tax=marine sediment metagenome TaxID=412755 RepID=X0UEI0_9ZZZZ
MDASLSSNSRRGNKKVARRGRAGTDPVDLITVTEAGKMLRVSRRTIERMIARGILPFYELPVRGGIRFSRTEIEAFLDARHRDKV